MKTICAHCGDNCLSDHLIFENKNFCCSGCLSVYQILNQQGLSSYYQIENTPGVSQKNNKAKDFDFVENEKVKQAIYEFSDGKTSRVCLYMPDIHCSSCIWLLENLHQLATGVMQSKVNFLKKQATIVFKEEELSLKDLLKLLTKIGYTPDVANSIQEKKIAKHKSTRSKSLIYKLGIAGFSFGNIMLLSFPEYLDTLNEITPEFANVFRYISFVFCLPVVVYSAKDYYISAYKSLRSGFLNIDVPISIGIITLFLRSSIDLFVYSNSAYFDSLAGLVFFLLIGKWFQDKTYNALSFDRNFKSFFPLAFKIEQPDGKALFKTLEEVGKNDVALIRNAEVVPADGVLLSNIASVDYSFVTGESVPVALQKGDYIFAGGQIAGTTARVQLEKKVSNSYLLKLWNERDNKQINHQKLLSTIDVISKKFTLGVLNIATLSALYWGFATSWSQALNIFSSVLIVACPCALALAAPFTFGHAVRFLGKKEIFFKNTSVIEKMKDVSTLVFDKTGTLTNTTNAKVEYIAQQPSKPDFGLLKLICQNSTHPLSRLLSRYYNNENTHHNIDQFQEHTGKGIQAKVNGDEYLLGSADFLKNKKVLFENIEQKNPKVYWAKNKEIIGVFVFHNSYREGVFEQIKKLNKYYRIAILSGDEDYEKATLTKALGTQVKIKFKQSPFDKKEYITKLQAEGENVAMFGDGLNDAGALAQSDVGISIIENIGSFSPASDIIIKADRLKNIQQIFQFSKACIRLLKMSLFFSLFYNFIGMAFAVSGHLTPLVAAILMPISSISVVTFVSFGVYLIYKKYKI